MASEFSIAVLFKLLDEMTKPLQKMGIQIQNQAKKIEQFGKKFEQAGKRMTMGLTLPIVAFGTLAVKEFAEADASAAELETAIEKVGMKGKISADRLIELSNKLQTLTNIEDETTQSTMAMLIQMARLSEDEVTKLIPLLQDWAVKMKINLSTAGVQLTKVLMGSTDRLGRYEIGIDKNTKASERFGKVTEFLTEKVGGTAEAMAKRGLGPLKSLQLTFNDLAEDFGKFILPTVNELAKGLKGFMQWIGKLDDGTKKMIITLAGILAVIGPLTAAFGGLITTIAGIVSAIGFLIANPVVLALVALGAAIVGIVVAVKAYNDRFDNAIAKTKSMRIQSESLIKEYQDLQRKTNKSNEEFLRMKIIQAELIKMNPTLINQVNKLTGELDLSTEAAKRYNEEMTKRELDALNKKLGDLAKKIKDTDEEIKDYAAWENSNLPELYKLEAKNKIEKLKTKREDLLLETQRITLEKQALIGTDKKTKETKKEIDAQKELNDAKKEGNEQAEDEARINAMLEKYGFVFHEKKWAPSNNVASAAIKGSVDVNIKVSAAPGSEARIKDVDKKGQVRPSVISESLLGYV